MPLELPDARLHALLLEADRALEVLRDPTPHGQSASDVMQTLDALHRDLGRRLHDLWQIGELEAAPASGGYLDEIHTMEPIDDLEEVATIGTPRPLGVDVRPPAGTEGAWVDDLQDLLALLEAPIEDTDAVSLAIEASRVQWATVGLRDLWPRFPAPIQLALLGMLAARCRWLQAHMAVDLGVERAQGRLAAYRKQAGLATVTGLALDRGPESTSWTDDALHWWDMLTAGIQA